MKHFILTILTLAALTANAQSKTVQLLDSIAHRFTFSGYAQAGWEYHQHKEPNNEFKINRIIVMSNLRITNRLSAFAMLEFKAFSLHELWVNYEIRPWLRVKFGQFKTPFSIENPLSPSLLETVPQLSMATSHMVAGGSQLMMPGGAGRDIGLTVYGDAGKYLSYDLAIMNGAGRNKTDDNAHKDFSARLTLHAMPQLDISASTIIGKGRAEKLDSALRVTVDPTLSHRDFTRNRFAVGAYLRTTPFDLRAEWMWGKNGQAKSNGGYVTALAKNIAVKGLDLIGSYDYLRDNSLSTNRFQAGIQYWFFRKCRVQLGYSYSKTDHQNGENAVLTQLQVGF